jgi:tetratricopeptide (TPR) repeat protein
MAKFGKVALLPMILSAVVAAAAGAQGTGSQCDYDENAGNLGMAVFALTAAQQPGSAPAEVTKQLRTAIGRMFSDDAKKNAQDNAKNPTGRAFTLGKIYMMFLSQDGTPAIVSRGYLGYKTDTATKVDLSVSIDSAFQIFEQRSPECAVLGGQWRQQQGWVRLVQQAMDVANSSADLFSKARTKDDSIKATKVVDSADAVAHEALRISPTAPYSHLVLGNVAAQRGKNLDAIKYYKDALEEAGKDTIFNDVRRTILYTLGNFAADAAQVDTVKANRDIFLIEAKSAFEALQKDPGKQYAEAARQGMTSVLRVMGDTAAIHSACKDEVANPSAYSFLALVQCGVTLAEVKDLGSATKLFVAAVALNPYHRDGLYNLAIMQIGNGDALFAVSRADTNHLNWAKASESMGQYQDAIKTIDRLLTVDPNNPENMKLYVQAYSGARKIDIYEANDYGKQWKLVAGNTARDQVHKKALLDSSAALDTPTKDALNNMVVWNTKADSMPMKVVFTEFTPSADKATLSGTIYNRTATVQSYSIDFDFLDKTGAKVSAGKVTVDKVPANSSAGFTVTGTAPGIAAFKYPRLDKP